MDSYLYKVMAGFIPTTPGEAAIMHMLNHINVNLQDVMNRLNRIEATTIGATEPVNWFEPTNVGSDSEFLLQHHACGSDDAVHIATQLDSTQELISKVDALLGKNRNYLETSSVSAKQYAKHLQQYQLTLRLMLWFNSRK